MGPKLHHTFGLLNFLQMGRGFSDNFGYSRHPGSTRPFRTQDEKKKLRAKRKVQRTAKQKNRAS